MTRHNKSLKKYTAKRNLKITGEPAGDSHVELEHPIFVVQKHDASHLHYDFRIEHNGVLVSWAIPKGPSTDPADKRLAIRTEDHPLDYSTFEGVIPEGNYGAGDVMVWDIGTYRNLKHDSLGTCIKNGEINIWLDGKKLKGGYALVKTNLSPKENWIFVKMRDDESHRNYDITKKKPNSALTGRSLKKIDKDNRD